MFTIIYIFKRKRSKFVLFSSKSPIKIFEVFYMILSISSLSFLSIFIFYQFPNFPSYIFDWLCVFAPMTGYFDQLLKMYQTKDSSKFRSGSSLVLLFSNFLRIVYWYGNRFAGYLLWQSVVTIIVHINLCFAYYKFLDPKALANDSSRSPHQSKSLLNLSPLEASSFFEFFLILLIYWFLIMAIVLFFALFINFRHIAEFIGLVSNIFDSFQTFPPFFQIVINRDSSCITTMLVLQFIAATCCKAVLFLCRPVPWPFRVGVAIQAFFVTFITIEFFRKKLFQSEKPVSSDSSDNSNLSSEYSD